MWNPGTIRTHGLPVLKELTPSVMESTNMWGRQGGGINWGNGTGGLWRWRICAEIGTKHEEARKWRERSCGHQRDSVSALEAEISMKVTEETLTLVFFQRAGSGYAGL